MEAKWWTLIAVCVATFMLLLDVTIVNVALPYIERSLDASFADLQWVVDAYALTLAALLLTGGSLADLYGRRLVFIVGLGIFTVASLACGFAGTALVLNLARGLQGVGGALMFATALALLAGAFQGADRGTAFGLWGATTGAAVAVGPLVGGALTEWLGWEAIFFVNVPIGLGAIALTLAKVQEVRGGAVGEVDWAGLLTFSTGLFALVFALIRGNPEGWGSPLIVGLLVLAAVALVAFVLVERAGAHPMLDLTLFRNPTFGGASIAAFVLSATIFSMFLYLTLYVQNILGYSALEAGDDWTALLAGFLVAGGGIGLVNPALATTAVGVVDARRSGMASGINSTFRQVGIATGIAGLGALFQHFVASAFVAPAGLASRAPAGGEIADFISFGGAARSGNEALARAGEQAFVTGLNDLLHYAAVVALLGAIAVAALVRQRDFVARAVPA